MQASNEFSKKSRATQTVGVLARVSARQARGFLVELTNLRDDAAALDRFLVRYGELLPKSELDPDLLKELHEHFSQEGVELPPPRRRVVMGDARSVALMLRNHVRSIWHAMTARTKQWRLLRLLHYVLQDDPLALVFHEVAVDPRPETPFEQVLMYLLDAVERSRFCQNSGCPAPYFFARRRSQKYCSEACARPAQREAKLRWWREVGAKRREQRARQGRNRRRRRIRERR